MLSNIRVQKVESIPLGGRLLLTGSDDGDDAILWYCGDFLDDGTACQLRETLQGLNWSQAAALLRACL